MEKINGVLINVTDEDIKLLEQNSEEFWEGVTSIGNYAFENCESLTLIDIPEGVKSIGAFAFRWCTTLRVVYVPNSVESLGYGAFAFCKRLTSVNVRNEYIRVGQALFDYCPGEIKWILEDDYSVDKNLY